MAAVQPTVSHHPHARHAPGAMQTHALLSYRPAAPPDGFAGTGLPADGFIAPVRHFVFVAFSSPTVQSSPGSDDAIIPHWRRLVSVF
ncbi:MAG: hypothetical protein QOK37_1209 [Thermoanaerobaculia bacterium]|jgi:hypothetical protein|nr:hypothetical protein [Thermoanaerobaculia bacterium]